jgi:hypothetical protein
MSVPPPLQFSLSYSFTLGLGGPGHAAPKSISAETPTVQSPVREKYGE